MQPELVTARYASHGCLVLLALVLLAGYAARQPPAAESPESRCYATAVESQLLCYISICAAGGSCATAILNQQLYCSCKSYYLNHQISWSHLPGKVEGAEVPQPRPAPAQ